MTEQGPAPLSPSGSFVVSPSTAEVQGAVKTPLRASPGFKYTRAPDAETDQEQSRVGPRKLVIIIGACVFVFVAMLGISLFVWMGRTERSQAELDRMVDKRLQQFEKLADRRNTVHDHNRKALEKHAKRQEHLLKKRQRAEERKRASQNKVRLLKEHANETKAQREKVDQMKRDAEQESDERTKQKMLLEANKQEKKVLIESDKLKKELLKAEEKVDEAEKEVAAVLEEVAKAEQEAVEHAAEEQAVEADQRTA